MAGGWFGWHGWVILDTAHLRRRRVGQDGLVACLDDGCTRTPAHTGHTRTLWSMDARSEPDPERQGGGGGRSVEGIEGQGCQAELAQIGQAVLLCHVRGMRR